MRAHKETLMLLTMCLCMLALCAVAYAADDAAGTYTNPVWNKDFPDPFVLRVGDKFYAFATQNSDAGFQSMQSPDMVHWTHTGPVFKPEWSKTHYWAPEVIEYKRKFYMTYSALNPTTNKHDIGIAVADKPLGPYTHKAILVHGDDNKVGVIDATVFVDLDKTPYLIYSEEEPRQIVLRKMAPDLLSVEQDKTVLVKPDRVWELGVTEAPTLIRKAGAYHLFFSVGWYQGTKVNCRYAVCNAVAKSVRGPYTKAPHAILQTVEGKVYGPGHQCVVSLPNGEMWMVYHGWDATNEPYYGSNPFGRTMRIDPIKWKNAMPYMDGPSSDAQPMPSVK